MNAPLMLITDELLVDLGACSAADKLLTHPACPPLPLPPSLALQLVADNLRTIEAQQMKPPAVAAMRWLTACMLQRTDGADLDALVSLHQPAIGIHVESASHSTVFCGRHSLVLLSYPTPTDVVLRMDEHAHVMLLGPITATLDDASPKKSEPTSSVACVHPGAQVVVPSEIDLRFHTWHKATGWWRGGIAGTVGAPY